jgi:ethanolamine ammonia-lyase large subunit
MKNMEWIKTETKWTHFYDYVAGELEIRIVDDFGTGEVDTYVKLNPYGTIDKRRYASLEDAKSDAALFVRETLKSSVFRATQMIAQKQDLIKKAQSAYDTML